MRVTLTFDRLAKIAGAVVTIAAAAYRASARLDTLERDMAAIHASQRETLSLVAKLAARQGIEVVAAGGAIAGDEPHPELEQLRRVSLDPFAFPVLVAAQQGSKATRDRGTHRGRVARDTTEDRPGGDSRRGRSSSRRGGVGSE